jgi:hypothetical protein
VEKGEAEKAEKCLSPAGSRPPAAAVATRDGCASTGLREECLQHKLTAHKPCSSVDGVDFALEGVDLWAAYRKRHVSGRNLSKLRES